ITVTVKRHYTRQYYLTDHLGSVRVTVNEQGDPVGWDDYYPFGLQMPGRTQNASNPNDDVKFTGHLLNQDGDLGFYYMIFRNYDPVIGRFMSPDPMQEYGSAYVYVGNNPIRWIDEFGLMSNDTLRVLPSGAADGGELPEIEVTAQGNRNATIHRISALERFLFRLDNLGRTENMFGDFVVHARNGHFRVNANQLNVSFGIPGDGLPIGPGGPLKIGTIWRTSKVMNANQLYHAVRPSHNLISVGLNSEKAKLFVNDTLTRLANTNKLKDGANTIITNVNGKTVTIRAYFRGNELQSWNIFAGQSSRTVGNIINESVK
ncbi:MAG: RHS repeat domain-containing protein, partial [Balneolaceae bacterium]